MKLSDQDRWAMIEVLYENTYDEDERAMGAFGSIRYDECAQTVDKMLAVVTGDGGGGEAEVTVLRAALSELALHGTHQDTSPTIGGGSSLGDGRDPVLWEEYLRRGDQTVREIARRALERADATRS